jgi:hypothetical protein
MLGPSLIAQGLGKLSEAVKLVVGSLP